MPEAYKFGRARGGDTRKINHAAVIGFSTDVYGATFPLETVPEQGHLFGVHSHRGLSRWTGRSPRVAAFSLLGAIMRRVIAYVDGFNLYHALADLQKPHLKWVDLHKLALSICGANETLMGVHYFTAYATWKPAQYLRHKEYVKALQYVGVRCVIGHFKQKYRQCLKCGAQWVGHEEKETDVAIAVQLMADAFTDQFDRALIISADSDLAPALRTIGQHHPRRTLDVIAPPGRFGAARDLRPKLEITPGRVAKALLPENAQDADGKLIFQRPTDYAPPP